MPPSHVDLERLEAVSALRAAGPDAPTLCAGWTTRDLAAHLVSRERRPDADLGLVVPPLQRWTERVRVRYARRDFESLLRRIERGPSRLSPWRWPGIENAANLLEYFVHAEDVRRAAPSWRPRRLDPDHEAQLWRHFARAARLSFRDRRTGVELRTPDGARRVSLDGPAPVQVVEGDVGELVLYAFGRREHALVTTAEA